MLVQLAHRLIVVSLHGGFLDRTVHALHLAIGPRVSWLGKTVFNAMLLTNTVKNMPIGLGLVAVSYTHLTLPTNREV